MSEDIIIAIVGVAGTGLGVIVSALAQHHRARFDEAQIIQDAIADNQRLWLWNRSLVDHIYKGLGPPPPEPPADLFERGG